MKSEKICPRTEKLLSDTECSDYICHASDIEACKACPRGEQLIGTVKAGKAKAAAQQHARQNPPRPRFEKITVNVPTELKERFRALSCGEMGSMSGQGRYLILRALERGEAVNRDAV